MNDIVNSLKTPFITLPEGETPPPRTVALVWLAVGVIAARVL